MLKHAKRLPTATPDPDDPTGHQHRGSRRVWAHRRQARGVTVRADPAGQTEDWLSGCGDLFIAGLGGRVPLAVQISVLAHADIGRLQDLGRHCRLVGPAPGARTWPAPAGDIARQAATPPALAALQHDVLIPLELDVLADHAPFSTTAGAVSYPRSHVPLPDRAGPH